MSAPNGGRGKQLLVTCRGRLIGRPLLFQRAPQLDALRAVHAVDAERNDIGFIVICHLDVSLLMSNDTPVPI